MLIRHGFWPNCTPLGGTVGLGWCRVPISRGLSLHLAGSHWRSVTRLAISQPGALAPPCAEIDHLSQQPAVPWAECGEPRPRILVLLGDVNCWGHRAGWRDPDGLTFKFPRIERKSVLSMEVKAIRSPLVLDVDCGSWEQERDRAPPLDGRLTG
jgi:hypothetical protein